MEFNLNNVVKAQERIKDKIIKTPLIRVEALDEFIGAEVYLKLENFQRTGSFKYRGAMNKILSLSDDELKKGIVAASSGNHGKAIAYACKELIIPATIVMPDTAPKLKVEAIKGLGAEVIMCDATERFVVAEKICNEKDATMIPPYNDEYVMAGQGTTGLEIIEELKDLDYVVVPVSGGGLIGGISTAIKGKSDKTKIIGAEPKNAAAYTESIKNGKISTAKYDQTVADALVSVRPGDINYPVVIDNVDEFMAVSEEYILMGMKLLLTEGKIFAEPSSGIGLGGILEGEFSFKEGDKVCFVISGGSVSFEQIEQLKEI